MDLIDAVVDFLRSLNLSLQIVKKDTKVKEIVIFVTNVKNLTIKEGI